jgi:hypothetical protein
MKRMNTLAIGRGNGLDYSSSYGGERRRATSRFIGCVSDFLVGFGQMI